MAPDFLADHIPCMEGQNKWVAEEEDKLLKIPPATLVQLAKQAKQTLISGVGKKLRQECFIKWRPAPEKFVKVNVHGHQQVTQGLEWEELLEMR